MNKEVIKYIRENYREADIFQDNIQSGYLIFCDETGQQFQPYKINNENVVFVVPENEWDENGWIDKSGFSFRYKLHFAGYRQDGVAHGKWSKVTVGMLWDLAHDYVLSHPKDVHLEVTGLSLENLHMTDGHYKWNMEGKPILNLERMK